MHIFRFLLLLWKSPATGRAAGPGPTPCVPAPFTPRAGARLPLELRWPVPPGGEAQLAWRVVSFGGNARRWGPRAGQETGGPWGAVRGWGLSSECTSNCVFRVTSQRHRCRAILKAVRGESQIASPFCPKAPHLCNTGYFLTLKAAANSSG